MPLIQGTQAVESLIGSLLTVGATTTSIYVVILTFVFARYDEFDSPATPGASVYFWSGSILLVAFIASAGSTLGMLGMEVGRLSYSRWPVYLLGVSLIVLVAGGTILGAGVFGSDWRDHLKEVQHAWQRRRRDSNHINQGEPGRPIFLPNPLIAVGGVITLVGASRISLSNGISRELLIPLVGFCVTASGFLVTGRSATQRLWGTLAVLFVLSLGFLIYPLYFTAIPNLHVQVLAVVIGVALGYTPKRR